MTLIGHQYNMMCPGDLVYADEYGDCVDYDRATDCKAGIENIIYPRQIQFKYP